MKSTDSEEITHNSPLSDDDAEAKNLDDENNEQLANLQNKTDEIRKFPSPTLTTLNSGIILSAAKKEKKKASDLSEKDKVGSQSVAFRSANSLVNDEAKAFNSDKTNETFPSSKPRKVSQSRHAIARNIHTRFSTTPNYAASTISIVSTMESKKGNIKNKEKNIQWWTWTSRIFTFWAPNFLLKKLGKMHEPAIQQAWREKVTLCTIILIIGIVLIYLTLGLERTLCNSSSNNDILVDNLPFLNRDTHPHALIIHGNLYDFGPFLTSHLSYRTISALPKSQSDILNQITGKDVTSWFPSQSISCQLSLVKNITWSCNNDVFPYVSYCHKVPLSNLMTYKIGAVRYPWSNLIKEGTTFSVYNGRLLNMKPYLNGNEKIFGNEVHEQILNGLGKDITYRFSTSDRLSNAVACMDELYAVGSIDQNTPGCIANKIILYMSLIVILGVVMTRFFMAIVFNWFLSWKLGKVEADREEYMQAMSLRNSSPANQVRPSLRSSTPSFNLVSSKENIHAMNRSSFLLFNSTSESTSGNLGLTSQLKENTKMPLELRQYHTLILVTCYSEGLDSMKETLNSIASTTYPDQYKLLFIVADGLITGSGNSQSTPDIVLSLMTDEIDMGPVLPQSYVAIADGAKRHNMAKVRIGYYVVDKHRVPMIVVIKCGTEEEKTTAKPGNRGKRDSQIILMDFFSKILFDDRLSPLQIDLFIKISVLAKVHPSNFEICLMVDADTKVDPESLSKMVTCMAQDPTIMGLCGETRIENKSQTWVTRIQVFEYYISHHLGKAFESVFGGVTCLPGCFCMYRLKAPRPDGSYVPIICSPNIIQQYSENVVDTLHKKNLLSLGEDRYLTTLMLRAFPKRKMVFVPKALCHTVVPHTLKMLLSQRRRWINSTIHNLLELLLVPQLCGTFCFSMQFVVFLELIGTVTLPAAISLTLFLLVSTFLGDVQWVPLVLLFCILGLPAILILLTTREIIYIYWMLTYLLALPVWNFLLPAYAFWHFDDFSWGQTRKVEGEAQGGDHSKKEGEFDSSVLQLKSLEDFFKESNNI